MKSLGYQEEQEWEFFSNLEKEWRESTPHLSQIEWLGIFPEAQEILLIKKREWQVERARLVGIAKQAIQRRTPVNAIETRLSLQVLVMPRIKDAEQQISR